MKALDFITSQPWAIEASALENILSILERRDDIDALAAKVGKPLEYTRTVENRDGVAVIPVSGPIFRYANLFTEISGATSTQVLATDFQTAIDDSSIRAVVLAVGNSPGGRADGIEELSDMIYAARGKKPIVTHVEAGAQSATYWFGSAADEVVISKTALVGSIGVVGTFLKDTGKADERAGVRRIEIVSSSSPNKRLDPESDEGRAAYQAIIDEMADVFIEAVARNRHVDADIVRSDFGRGGSLLGRTAVRAGMADRTGSLESVVARLADKGNGQLRRTLHMTTKRKSIAVSTTAELHAAGDEGYTLEQITIKEPDLEAIRAEARAEGKKEGIKEAEGQMQFVQEEVVKEATTAERERIAGIQAVAMPGFEKEVQEAIESGASVADYAVTQAKVAKDRGITLQQLQGDGTKAVDHANPGTETKDSGWSKVTAKFGTKR